MLKKNIGCSTRKIVVKTQH